MLEEEKIVLFGKTDFFFYIERRRTGFSVGI
jgi:hypothetical protein